MRVREDGQFLEHDATAHTFPVGNVVRGQLNKTKTIPHVTKKMHSHFLYGLSIIVLRDVIKIVCL